MSIFQCSRFERIDTATTSMIWTFVDSKQKRETANPLITRTRMWIEVALFYSPFKPFKYFKVTSYSSGTSRNVAQVGLILIISGGEEWVQHFMYRAPTFFPIIWLEFRYSDICGFFVVGLL